MYVDLPTLGIIVGTVILSTSLILRMRLHYQRVAKRTAERHARALAAKEAERKRLAMTGDPPKVKPSSGARTAPERIPLGEPIDTVFAAGVQPRNIAKWEAEIHQIGRQMIGQLDSKSVVLQTLTLEANRAANRLEILIDHLETLLKNDAAPPPPPQTEPVTELSTEAVDLDSSQPNLIHREDVPATVHALADVLEELENEIDQLHKPIEEAVPSMRVLKVGPTEEPVPISPANVSTVSQGAHRITVLPRGVEFWADSDPTPSLTPPPSKRQSGLSFTSLFEDNLVTQREEPRTTSGPLSIPTNQTPLIEPSLDKRRQAEMLADYGYSPQRIAQDLNLTVGEVELIISLRN